MFAADAIPHAFAEHCEKRDDWLISTWPP